MPTKQGEQTMPRDKDFEDRRNVSLMRDMLRIRLGCEGGNDYPPPRTPDQLKWDLEAARQRSKPQLKLVAKSDPETN
ncbi:MAG: hypothetical protein JJ961_12705 [Roseitalea sp.]|nr:hypothetical protein [Roseitalea sp.]MBO6592728.1 hypothetical protein [Roseitalea sp.]MBO6600529.1 hypothetical protein [Roseitalea sp.]MBO6706084.1 hypothetical protein [Roseitalea sp.]MBO6734716.1 hypothetical protein [Roseitalea sp.]